MIFAKSSKRFLSALVLSAVLIFAVSVAFAAGDCITYKIASSAQISKVSYYMGEWKKQKTVIFEVAIKNISTQPKRFKLTVDIPDGPSASYLYPPTGKPPVIKPGAEFVKPMPMVIQDSLPASFSIIVSEMTE